MITTDPGNSIPVAVSSDGALVAVGGADGVVELWDSRGSGPPIRIMAHNDQVKTLAFHPRVPRLASSGMDRTVILWDAETGEKILSYDGDHEGTVYSLAFSPDGSLLATGSYDGWVRLFVAENGSEPAVKVAEARSSVRSVAFSPDGASIVAAAADGSILTCSSARPAISGSELGEIQAISEILINQTRV